MFMNPEKNPIVKAFDGSKGRGLAGVITQMSLGYDKSLWGTSFDKGGTTKGLRAPKSVEINLSFSPVHDLPLGLDYSGELFAPSHPVGMYSSTTMEESQHDPNFTPNLKYVNREAKITADAGNLVLDESELEDPTEPKGLF